MSTDAAPGLHTAIQIGLIALLAFWCFQIALPFVGLIAWAGIIAIGVYPLVRLLKEKSGFSDGKASLVVTLIALIVLIVPTVLLTEAIIKNTGSLSKYLKDDSLVIPPPGDEIGNIPLVGKDLAAFWQKASEDPRAVFGEYEAEIRKLLNSFLSTALTTGLNILMFVFSIILAGVFMASARNTTMALEAVFTRLAGDNGAQLTKLSHDTVQSVVRGILGIALAQAFLSGLGFLMMDIPASGLLVVICLILAIVQIDILIVLIPLSIYMFNDPDTGTVAAVIFLIWNIIVGLMNNVLKPILLGQGVEAPMAVIFIGAIGGMLLHGIIGLFIGSVVMVLGYSLFMFWVRQAAHEPEAQ